MSVSRRFTKDVLEETLPAGSSIEEMKEKRLSMNGSEKNSIEDNKKQRLSMDSRAANHSLSMDEMKNKRLNMGGGK